MDLTSVASLVRAANDKNVTMGRQEIWQESRLIRESQKPREECVPDVWSSRAENWCRE